MPLHDWTRVEAGIFHAFLHRWITALSDALNGGLLPEEYYALPEQQAAGFGPDVLTLQGQQSPPKKGGRPGAGAALHTRPSTRWTAQTDTEFYRRKKSSIVVRHVSGDSIVAMLEILSPGNKSGRHAFRALVEKACELLEHRIHLLLIDPFPPGPRDPQGIHAAIWEAVEDQPFTLPDPGLRTFVAYECDLLTRAFIEAVAVGGRLPDMPLFLEPDGCVMLPLEATYQASFEAMPRRWQTVLAAP